jgi:heavy metal translocating P-type ATPase
MLYTFFVIGSTLLSILLHYILDSNIPYFIGFILGGVPMIYQVLQKLRNKNFGADSLAAIGIISGMILGQYLATSIIILMLATGILIEKMAYQKASSVLAALAKRMPEYAHHSTPDGIKPLSLDKIKVGDILIVMPFEACPVDGLVIQGNSNMDESYLTGEPYQISKAPGSVVYAGTLNGAGTLHIQAQKKAHDSRYERIVDVLKKSQTEKPKFRRIADQIGAWFSPFALLFALIAGYISQDATRFLAILFSATPCPLLIAIPLTIVSAISYAAKHSIIIKDASILERLPQCTTAIFDKTGTLTLGKPTLTQLITANGISEPLILQLTASLEQYSKHPLASAIIQASKDRNIPFLEVTQLSEEPGRGLSGQINQHQLLITNRKKSNIPNSQLPPLETGLECLVLLDGQYAATFQFHDQTQKECHAFIKHLPYSHSFTKIMLVSGDRMSEVEYLGKQLKLTELYASQSPLDKLAIVLKERLSATTVFIGDGINDAPALNAADVGIAFGEYSEVTAAASGAVILENKLEKIDQLLHLGISTRQIVLESAIGGMALSLICMVAAALGYINPVEGALLQEIIDVVAILNALKINWLSY